MSTPNQAPRRASRQREIPTRGIESDPQHYTKIGHYVYDYLIPNRIISDLQHTILGMAARHTTGRGRRIDGKTRRPLGVDWTYAQWAEKVGKEESVVREAILDLERRGLMMRQIINGRIYRSLADEASCRAAPPYDPLYKSKRLRCSERKAERERERPPAEETIELQAAADQPPAPVRLIYYSFGFEQELIFRASAPDVGEIHISVTPARPDPAPATRAAPAKEKTPPAPHLANLIAPPPADPFPPPDDLESAWGAYTEELCWTLWRHHADHDLKTRIIGAAPGVPLEYFERRCRRKFRDRIKAARDHDPGLLPRLASDAAEDYRKAQADIKNSYRDIKTAPETAEIPGGFLLQVLADEARRRGIPEDQIDFRTEEFEELVRTRWGEQCTQPRTNTTNNPLPINDYKDYEVGKFPRPDARPSRDPEAVRYPDPTGQATTDPDTK